MQIKKYKLYDREGIYYFDVSLYLANELKRLRFSSTLKANKSSKEFLEAKGDELVKLYIKTGDNSNFKSFYESYYKDLEAKFDYHCELFLKSINGLKKTSQITNKQRLINARIFFKNKLIKDISKKDIREFYEFLEKLRAKGEFSTNHIKAQALALNRVLEYAYENDYIEHNPFFKKRYAKEKKKELFPFNEKEIIALLKYSRAEIRLYLYTALLCGARTGEILALQFRHFDFENKKIIIEQSVNNISGINTCKTSNSHRKIDLLPTLENEILKEIEKRKEQNRFSPDSFLFDLKFKNEPIKNFQNSILKVQYIQLLNALNITYRAIYNTRHSFASLMLNKGENIMWVSNMLGHTNTQTTWSFYSKYMENENNKRAEFLKDIL
ncbi:tyrosine-type recombinase/integrase [Campylobacter sp. VTCC 70190]|uniref:tyrosine-type recombinase/integrase n=1 Tax=Campylobacter sp. VTCC 70190 TaxID=3392118 RepID=UPI00398E9BAE